MGLVIGMDEAGYGPNLGPLVVTATVWEVPGRPDEADFWKLLRTVVVRDPKSSHKKLHINDSKAVYNSARGIGPLERSVLGVLRGVGHHPGGWRELSVLLTGGQVDLDGEPWFTGRDLPLPSTRHDLCFDELANRWRECCTKSGVRLRAVVSDVVLTRRFNSAVRDAGSKGVALSRITLELLRRVWDPNGDEPTLVIGDKHGGRNRYDLLLQEVLDGVMIFRRQEGRESSRYRVNRTELRFEPRAEAHLPVAFASLVCKYLRQLSMSLFNAYWREHLPELKPTQGYSTDCLRFRDEITATAERLGLAADDWWRER
ncbi:MAG: hypothetical protein WD066_01255 [Planctomycetaceae bacterium]